MSTSLTYAEIVTRIDQINRILDDIREQLEVIKGEYGVAIDQYAAKNLLHEQYGLKAERFQLENMLKRMRASEQVFIR